MEIEIDFNNTVDVITLELSGATESQVEYICNRMDNYYDANGLENFFITGSDKQFSVLVCWAEGYSFPEEKDLKENLERWFKEVE